MTPAAQSQGRNGASKPRLSGQARVDLILKLRNENPRMSGVEIAQLVDCNPSHVSRVLSTARRQEQEVASQARLEEIEE